MGVSCTNGARDDNEPTPTKGVTVSTLNPYLNFRGQARAAMEFYSSVFGGEATFSTFNDFGMTAAPDEVDLIMHAQLITPGGLTIMAADAPGHIDLTVGNNISCSLSGTEEEELTGYWERLADGAVISEQLAKAPWGDSFGMLVDRFGIQWLVNISAGATG